MKTSTLVWVIIIVLVILGLWWWMAASPTPSMNGFATTTPTNALGLNDSPNQTNTGQASSTILLSVATSTKLGNYLVATSHMTLYRFAQDKPGVSNCSGDCASIWRPYLVATPNEPLLPGSGVTGQLSTITRSDGGRQLTYKGMPLYYYRNDAKPGDTTGQNVGGIWFVVTP